MGTAAALLNGREIYLSRQAFSHAVHPTVRGCRLVAVTTTTIRLLEAAAGIAGGTRALAERLDISETTLERFLDGSRELPDALLLRAVDIILADRQPHDTLPVQSLGSSRLPT
jgi:hypothetical protein